ncbi:transcriptional regulator with XRE-family HTH domain [Clostridium acetobutylicum]|uniref:Predicted transcriptional regulator n=1 Tax=Clostridium acetobutylicum (strain ATCC 824 / DSM 792 / JCM 1419 / IAM 19013 / LMG 5710 / NBRC 13948 / NRRL B-527 / VKM B-1787 / 2291 / W) TaxID=272562 RepID=Q97HF6_CLOAB|nr:MULTISPECIES: helix-turn-helix transcriptional regulator [Clostridium]AAK80014.1 Predicted transcriptional regulator [Clostridium acetobutylicum ATCC 824]ADZ21106.1 transcriptional regulator [Clostridium acetobutylicum EA 2018]AEI32161.1 transcriptional regulator [Clostridium acetobutylicum DSM 1731]AWV79557.1 XRE family transcriptional regulator [Clostridium acetobutylicum]MBC2394469.1 helix-turn-helix transcriptional regulator [Clostridium acetobutylicum]
MDNKLSKIPTETFGEYIKRIRELRGYSQRKLSTLSDLSNTTICRIEKGSENGIENPDAETVVKLAEGLKLEKKALLIAAGYLDNENVEETTDLKECIRIALQKLGWINSYNDINEETITYVEFLLKKYGNKYKQIP